MTDLDPLIRRLTNPPFGAETSERNLMSEAVRALIAMTKDRDLSVAEAHQMGEERARWKERAEAAEAERDALTDRLAQVTVERNAACKVADGYKADFHARLGSEGLAPVPPLAAALRLPEVAAMRAAIGGLIERYEEVVTTPDRSCGSDDHDVVVARTALAALEATELRGAE